MESILLTSLKFYGIFCLTTTICCLWIQLQAIIDSGTRFTFWGWITYLSLTIFMLMLLAPIFFVVFIGASDSYYEKIFTRLLDDNVDTDD